MQGKIGLEEHFAIDDTLMDSKGFLPDETWPELKARLVDLHGRRISLMDTHGIEMMILSLNAPAVQAIGDRSRAADVAKRANDFLAEVVAKNPQRFRGLAALALQDADGAARELERCVRELGFVGALANGFSQIEGDERLYYYDLPQYRPFWATVAALDVPFYLHPRNPLARDARIYEGHGWLMGPAWAFGQETAVHALRLMGSGLFDVHPGLNIILGHMGEGIPYNLWRVDNKNAWVPSPPRYPAKRRIADYFQENFHLTTSGNFSTRTLVAAMAEVSADRVLFSTDWPFENIDHAADWFDAAAISERDRAKIGRDNAIALFKLDLPTST